MNAVRWLLGGVSCLLIASCTPSTSFVKVKQNENFTIHDKRGTLLFDITMPSQGQWKVWHLNDILKDGMKKDLLIVYAGKHAGMTYAEMTLDFAGPCINCKGTLEDLQQQTTVQAMKQSMHEMLTEKINNYTFFNYHKPSELDYGIRQIGGLNCRWYRILKHRGPKLDSSVKEFRGLGGARREDRYFCPVMRDDGFWIAYLDINFEYSDQIHQYEKYKDIPPSHVVFKRFDEMLQPTIDSIRFYGDLKQY